MIFFEVVLKTEQTNCPKKSLDNKTFFLSFEQLKEKNILVKKKILDSELKIRDLI